MKIVILGGGISGLLAAYSLRHHNVTVVEKGPTMGGTYTAGGLKYIRRTDSFLKLLMELKVEWSHHRPVGMLLDGKQLRRHPDWLSGLPLDDREFIQKLHWKKTRGTEDGWRPDCMNDPMGEGADTALKCDHTRLINTLTIKAGQAGVRMLVNERVSNISPATVATANDNGGQVLDYDKLVVTLPMAILSQAAPWARLPSQWPRALTVVDLFTPSYQARPLWDYIYTPMMQSVSRVTWLKPGHFQAEAPGAEHDAQNIYTDVFQMIDAFMPMAAATLAFGAKKEQQPRVIPGHLPPLEAPLSWPDNWLALGRFAEWNPRSTAEKVYDRVLDWNHAIS